MFKANLQSLHVYESEGFTETIQEEDQYLDKSQNTICIYVTQLKATSKIASMEEEDYCSFKLDQNTCLDKFEIRKQQENNKTIRCPAGSTTP